MSIFDLISSANQRNVAKPAGSLFDAISNYFKPSADGVRTRDVVRELPGATKKVGQEIVKGFARFAVSAGESIPRVVRPDLAGTVDPQYKIPGVGKFESYQSTAAKNEASGANPALEAAKAVGQAAIDEPVGVAFKPLFLVGSLLFKGAGKTGLKDAVEFIAKSKSVEEITATLKKFFTGSDEEVSLLAQRLTAVEDPKVVSQTIQEVVDAQKANQPLAQYDEATKTGALSADEAVAKGMSKEEFVKAQGDTIYRGSSEPFNASKMNINERDPGTSFSTDRNITKFFAGKSGDKGISEFVVSKDARIIDTKDIPTSAAQKGNIELEAQWARKNGYDGYRTNINGENEVRIFNPDVLKTKSQLSAQYDEAVKGGTDASKELGFVTTAKESPTTVPEVKAGLEERYTPITNKITIEDAQKFIDTNIDEAYRIAKSTRPPTAFDNTVSQLLAKKIQDQAVALKETDPAQAAKLYDDVIDIIENVARKAKTQGQAIQSLSIFNKLTPEGVLTYTQRQINKVNESIINPAKKITLTPKISADLISTVEKIQKLPEGEDKIVETAVLLKKITDLFPSSFLDKVSATQTLAQLLNPKTTIRNIGGNAAFALAEQVSGTVSVGLDSALSLITGKRSVSLPNLRVQASGFRTGFKEGLRDALKGIDTGGPVGQFDLPKTQVFKGSVGQGAQKLLDVTLRVPDRAFFNAAYDGSLYQQMKAAKVTVPTEEMREIAYKDGLYRTFQDENVTTYIFKGIKNVLNVGKEFGVGDLVLKYPKTPANLLNRGLAYSPAGFLNATLELAKPLLGKGKFNQKKFVETTGRALTGTGMAFGTGALLHKLGIVTTDRDPSTDVAQAKKESGLGQYKINVSALKRFVLGSFDTNLAKLEKGDTLVSYDWFQPLAIAIALGADFDKNKGDSVSLLSTFLSGVAAGADTLAEQPLVASLTTPLKYGSLSDAGVRVLQSLPSSFTPTLLNQIKQLKDNTARNTYDPDTITYAFNLAKNKIPGISEFLPPKYGSFGQRQEVYQGASNSLFNVFFNPAFVTKYKPTPEAQMVLDIYQNTGEKKQLPNIVSKTQEINGVSRKLTAREVTNLQHYTGTTIREIFSALASSPEFMNQADEDKAKILSGLITDVGSASKIIFLGQIPKRNPGADVTALIKGFIENNRVRTSGPQESQ